MKHFLAFFMLLLMSFGAKAQSPNADDNKIQVVTAYLAAAFKGDYEKQKQLMHPEIVDYHPTVLLPPARGKEELIKGWMDSVEPMDSVIYTRQGIGMTTLDGGVNKQRGRASPPTVKHCITTKT